jgi:hypothetical protein
MNASKCLMYIGVGAFITCMASAAVLFLEVVL